MGEKIPEQTIIFRYLRVSVDGDKTQLTGIMILTQAETSQRNGKQFTII